MQGITMQGPSVLSTLAGNKTQTRRVMKEQPLTHYGNSVEFDGIMTHGAKEAFFAAWENGEAVASQSIKIPHPVGAVRYVKEAYWPAPVKFSNDSNNCVDNDGNPRYVGWDCTMDEDSRDCARSYGVKPKGPFFMPQWASRLHIEIVGVRVERVQSISDADVMAEGCLTAPEFIKDGQKIPVMYKLIGGAWRKTKSEAFASYFGQKAWDSNPWVFVYDYKVIWKKEG